MIRRALVAAVLTTAWLALPGAVSAQQVQHINPQSASNTSGPPFSGAVRVGNTVYVSGTLGLDPGQQSPATATAEARNVLTNIRSTLQAAGLTMDDLVWVQVNCTDVANYDAFNQVYRTFFTREFPARAFLGAGPLLFGARFEVMGIAVAR